MFKRKRSADDFAEEIKAHLALEADDLTREGLNAVSYTHLDKPHGVSVSQE